MAQINRVVRGITADELIEARKIDTIAFRGRFDEEKEAEEPLTPEQISDREDNVSNYRAAFIDGKMTACMLALPYKMRFDGHETVMWGIGGVASLPEQRRTGSVRQIFEELLPEMYDNDVVFSVLYPFSPVFYRQFGYEMSQMLHGVKIPVKAFSGFSEGGSFKQYLPEEPKDDIIEIYNKYIQQENLNQAILRTEKLWQRMISHDPYSTGRHTYVWYDNNDAPRGYLNFEDRSDGKRNILVRDLAFDGRDGLYGIFSLLRSMSAAYDEVEFEFPEHMPIDNIIPDTYDVSMHIRYCGQTRVINAAKALTLMEKPKGAGRLTVAVTDNIIAGNNGCFTVEFDESGTRVDFDKDVVTGDLVVSMPAFSQLVIGYTDLRGALLTRKDVVLNGNEELLSRVFTKKPQHLTEKF